MHAAVKIQVKIPKNRLVQLPNELPEGQAEIIVLYPEPSTSEKRSRLRTRSAPAPTERMRYFERLTSRQPVPLTAEASRALDEADRGER